MRSPYFASQSRISPGSCCMSLIKSSSGAVAYHKPASRNCFCLPACSNRERHVAVMAEVTNAFRTNYVLGPFGCDKAVELMDVERRTAVIYKCTDAVLLYFASLVMVMMVVMFMLIMVVFLVMLVGFVVMSVCVSLPFLFLGSLLARCRESILPTLPLFQNQTDAC